MSRSFLGLYGASLANDDSAALQGVGEKDWIFQTTFSVTADELALPYNDLVFGGLDTYAEVFLVSW